jgi:hypothetical protein
MLLFPSAQINQYVTIATGTYRFETGMARTAGQKAALNLGYEIYAYGNTMIVEDKDLRPDRVFGGASEMIKKFEAIPLSLAEDEAGAWTRVSGASGIADAVMGLLRWYHNIGILQRSAWGMLGTLTVPTPFATAPPTL